ncbi:hypothetical protein [uncultured Aquimarina sp.]|uniref:hypothetical protein n=1 Tax=uncultured Aquimarina sp. TaxID=575652 RepID=UPI002620A957|nr:hypothetical protein [uncultured Aquimarina sp.]
MISRKKEFASVWETTNTRKAYKEARYDLQAVEKQAVEVAKKIVPFSFAAFERKLFRKKNEGVKVYYHYKGIISEYTKQNRISTANSYSYSKEQLKISQNS